MTDTTGPRDLKEALARIAEETEVELARLLSADRMDPGPGEHRVPERLLAAMRYAVLGGGKRLRPCLVVETAALFGDTAAPSARARAIRTGAALELVHGYSLVHDDLPAMDDDDLRRGKPTTHIAFDEATAILAGDALLTLAFEAVTDPAAHPDGAVRADLARLLARAAGMAGMVGGQMLDLEAEGRFGTARGPRGEAHVARVQAMKTGALFGFAAEAGGRLGHADANQLRALQAYARAFGYAFQIADDVLDATASPKDLGKATAKDADAGKATLVDLLGLDGARRRLDETVTSAQDALAPFGARAARLQALAAYARDRSN